MFGKIDDEKAFKLLKQSFDSAGYRYEADDAHLALRAMFKGNDLPILFESRVYDGALHMESVLRFVVPKDKMQDFVWEINKINGNLRFGNFVMDPDSGKALFAYAYLFEEAKPSEELILQIAHMVIGTADDYDGRLAKLIQ